ncbi:hypothetical protein GW846_05355 [Candidatus Gracilibacteria bacterium]|nr:hypothetical protein [Candidatus Gracilibacteria bacterium]
MKKILTSSPQGYSIIIAVLTIGFLLVLTTSTLTLALQEMQDGKGSQDYMKAYSAAEGGLELALLKIKDNGYGYYGQLNDSKILGGGNKDPKISYDFDSKVESYSGTIDGFQSDIVPLFWTDNSGVMRSTNAITLTSTDSNLIWNIVGEKSGISGIGAITNSTTVGKKEITTVSGNTDFTFTQSQGVQDFVATNPESYLIIYNSGNTEISYTLNSGNEAITKPRALVISSAKVGKYTQNLETVIDNTEFLGILKYSIYSGN